MPRRALPLALLSSLALLFAVPSFAQSGAVALRGRFIDPTSRAPVPGVKVTLTDLADTTRVRRATAGEDGGFAFRDLAPQRYRLEGARLGYAPLRFVLRVDQPDQDAGVLALTPESVPVKGVTVTESPAPAIQKADTTEFRASAVKTEKNATAEELVQKMPGVTMENGQLKAQGEQVRNVLVNGRPFFGSDPTAAMRNLPAEVVDRIQVYDRQSDQSEFSGFDDGTAEKTMNFILRDQKAQFGRFTGGYGDQDRYQASANASLVRGATRLTMLGMSNNVNQQNFSPQDLIGAMGGGGPGMRMMMMGGGFRRPGGGSPRVMRFGGGGGFDPGSFLVGQQAGVSTTHSGGANYSGEWGPRLKVSASLFANGTDTDNRQLLARQYLPVQDSLAFYDQTTTSDDRNRNQRFDARFEWTPDSMNSVILQPRAYLQQTDSRSNGTARNATPDDIALGAATNASSGSNDADNLSSRLILRHRFARRGRNVSLDLNGGRNLRNGDGAQRSLTDDFSSDTTVSDTLDQRSTSHVTTNSLGARLAYTDRLSDHIQAQLILNPSLTRSTSRARTFALDPLTGSYTLPDSTTSNSFENRTTAQNAGVATLFTQGQWKFLTNLSYQRTTLHSEQTYPLDATIEHAFDELLPSATLTGTFKNRSNLRLAWNTSSNAPSISQLQNVVNNSNPLSLSTGNPDLRSTYANSVSLRFSQADPLRSRSRFVFANVTRTARAIGNDTFTASRDTVIDGISLSPGVQLTRQANLDASWNANLFGVWSRPILGTKTTASLNGGGSFTRTPSRINGLANQADSWNLRSGLTLASNISPNLDYTVSYQGSWNIARNSLTTSNRGDYYSHVLGVRLNVVAGPGIVFREEMSHNLQSGVPSDYGQNVVLWNSSVGKKLFKDGAGEFRITATDVLQQNRAVNRNITDSYVEDTRDRALGRYVQGVFTWSFK